MSIIRIIIDAFNSILEVYILSLYFKMFMVKRNSIVQEVVFFITTAVGITLTSVISESTLTSMLGFILFMGFYSFLYKTSLLKKCYCIISIFLFMLLSEVIVGILLSIIHSMNIDEIKNSEAFYLQGAALSKVVLLMILKLVGVFKINAHQTLDKKSIMSLALIPLSTIISIYYFNAIAYESGIITGSQALILTVLLCSSSIAAFYLMENQMKAREIEKRFFDIKNQYETQTQYYKNMKEMTLLTNRNAHDIKNFLIGIRSYLDQERIGEAENKIEEFYNSIPITSGRSSGNVTVDALLTSKMEEIINVSPRNKVSVICTLENIDEIDFCILLGNAIDNAIEESRRIPDKSKRFIEIRVMPFNSNISISIVNTKENRKETSSKTSKSNKLFHGFGIENMKTICEKYQGDLQIKESETQFYLSILLPNNQES